ncbi:MAG: PAS domain S-box protein [Deltaproteobacteria bacterium]|nr:PAS domain S-box protein [Deltaproteobacteria bacterium]MBN2673800.1 PAS domain S-box protein [Deltaproteobacteria bacterium]
MTQTQTPNRPEFASALKHVREQITDQIWLYAAIIVPLLWGISIWRFTHGESVDLAFTHFLTGVLTISIAVYRRKLPFFFKAGLLLAFWSAMGTAGIFYFGLVGAGHIMLIGGSFLSFIMIGIQLGTLYAAFNGVILLAFGVSITQHWVQPITDISVYGTSTTAWASILAIFILLTLLARVALKSITEKMADAFSQILKSEQKYRTIFNASSDAVFIHDAETGIAIDVNDAMLAMYQCNRDDIVNNPDGPIRFSSNAPPYTPDVIPQKIQLAKSDGPLTFEWQARKKNGELFWVEVTLRYSEIEDEKQVIAAVRDITERKRADEILVQSEKMLSVGGLAAGIAHELNNPLSGMMQNAQVLQERFGNLDSPKTRKAIDQIGIDKEKLSQFLDHRKLLESLHCIRITGQRASEIITNMLRFARMSNDEFIPENIPLLLDRTLELAQSDFSLKKHYDVKQIKVRKKYSEDTPSVYCVPTKIQQVFLNILRNGAEAMHEKGDAFIQNEAQFTLRVYANPTTDEVIIEIEDNGPGMSEENRKRIFEPFYTTKPVGEGTGLGLSVSYFIVANNHRGTLLAQSTPGKGTTFTISLPVVPTQGIPPLTSTPASAKRPA